MVDSVYLRGSRAIDDTICNLLRIQTWDPSQAKEVCIPFIARPALRQQFLDPQMFMICKQRSKQKVIFANLLLLSSDIVWAHFETRRVEPLHNVQVLSYQWPCSCWYATSCWNDASHWWPFSSSHSKPMSSNR